MALIDQLRQILPDVLPKTPKEAIKGTELINKVRKRLEERNLKRDYEDSTLQQHFSVLSKDPTSPMAKKDQGHGYYLRPPLEEESSTLPCEKNVDTRFHSNRETINQDNTRALQSEEKFRSLFMRREELNNAFPMHIEHTRGTKQPAGINKWKFPDVVFVEWEVGEVTDGGFRLDKDRLEVKRSLGEQPFRLTSVELKVQLNASNLREAFFQCVSNSKWAHSAQLTIACEVSDEAVAGELRRLGASNDVSVVSFGLDEEFLRKLPPADELLKSPTGEIQKHVEQISPVTLVIGRNRKTLDWEHIEDLRTQSPDIVNLLKWIARCLEHKAAYAYTEWKEKHS